jgi:hypothetical protein
MSESSDYDPGPWKGESFASARATYDKHAARSYDDAVKVDKKAVDLVPDFVSTDSEGALIIVTDDTGSMGDWTANIFGKLAYLAIEGQQYLGKGMEICFAAVGDATCDKYPLQIRPFSKDLELKKQLTELVIEGGGGGQTTESYELAALYFARNLRTPKATRKPIVIFIGDEQPYSLLKADYANRYAKVLINQNMSDEDIFEALKENCAVYIIRKPYDTSSEEPGIRRHWVKLLGEDHIAELPDEARVLDVIFGILAKETNLIGYFHKEIEERQTKAQVATAYRSLATIHAGIDGHSGKSVMIRPGDGKLSRSLLDD